MGIKSYLVKRIKGHSLIKVEPQISFFETNEILSKKKIIITGGGRGLGFAMAKKFKAEGAEVLIAGRNEDTLRKSAGEIGANYLKLDITNTETFPQFISEANRLMGGLTTLVNNAGISLHEQTFFDVTPESWDKQFDTNLKGSFFLTQAFVKHIKENKQKANVLFISSETGDTMDFRPYGFTKVAINSMVQGLAYLFRQEGIRVNAVAPGVTASDMTGVAADGNYYACSYGQGRFYMPEEVAEVAAFLISDASDCISGQIITCNNAQTVNARWK